MITLAKIVLCIVIVLIGAFIAFLFVNFMSMLMQFLKWSDLAWIIGVVIVFVGAVGGLYWLVFA